ncbi:MAG: acetyl-CoA carboxylase carboxyl transferase subunit alpha, partial [Candidatus Latescibacterota bacterium]
MAEQNQKKSPGVQARKYLDFEKPIFELESKILELKQVASVQNIPVDDEIRRLSEKAKRLRNDIYSKLTAWQQVQ